MEAEYNVRIQEDNNLGSILTALQVLMVDENEISVFQDFRDAPAHASRLHPGLKHESHYDRQCAVFRPLPSKYVNPI